MDEARKQTEDEEIVCRVALTCTEGVGPATFDELLKAYGTCCEVVFKSRKRPLRALPRISAGIVDAILRIRDDMPRWQAMLSKLEETGIQVLSGSGPAYPQALKALERPPPVLFVKGELRKQDQRGLAIVGSTRPTSQGRETAIESARRSARKGCTVISGLARGVDSAAHWGAMAADGRTVAFPATGLAMISPTRELQQPSAICQSGALVSPFPPCQRWETGAAMRRNWLVAAMSQGVFVVESGRDGGAVYTARAARSLGRPVFALSRRESGKETAGNRQLLEGGATEITCLADVDRMVERVCGDSTKNG